MNERDNDIPGTLTDALRRLELSLDPTTQPLTKKLAEVESRLRTLMSDSIKRPFTPHDFDHAVEVEQYAAALCKFITPSSPLRREPRNLYYLTLSIWFHDSGMVPMAESETPADIRTNHHLRIEPFLHKYFSDLFDQSEIRLISAVARNHCEDTPELLPAKTTYHRVEGNRRVANVAEFPRLYASILRIADICAITYTRTPWLLYRHYEMNPVSQKHWEAHLNIHAVGFEPSADGQAQVFVEFAYSSLSLRTFIEQHVKRIEEEIRKCSATLVEGGLSLSETVEVRSHEERPGTEDGFTVLPRGVYQLLVRGIYGRKDIFIRELVQNGLDAMTRQVASEGSCVPTQLDVTVTYEGSRAPENIRRIAVRDHGIGMDHADIDSYVLQVTAKSIDDPDVRKELEAADLDIIAEWGIGFLSVFAVTDHVLVRSHKTRMRPIRVEFAPLGSVDGKETSLSEIRARATDDDGLEEHIARGTEIAMLLPHGLDFDPLQRLRSYFRYPTVPVYYVERCPDAQNCTLEPKKPEPPESGGVGVTADGVRGGWITFDPERSGHGLEISQAGLLVEEHAMDLLPASIQGIHGVIDCRTKCLPLTAARSEVVRESPELRTLQNVLVAAVPRAVGDSLHRSGKHAINDAHPKIVWEAIESILNSADVPDSVRQDLLAAVEKRCFVRTREKGLEPLSKFSARLMNAGEKKVYLYSVGVDAESGLFGHPHRRVEHVEIWIPHQSVVSLEEQRLVKANRCLIQITPFYRSSGAGGQYHNHQLMVALFTKQGIEIDESLLREGYTKPVKSPAISTDVLARITGIDDWAVSDQDGRARCVGFWDNRFHFELNRARPAVQGLLKLWNDAPEQRQLATLLLRCYAESLRVDPAQVVKAIEEYVGKL